MKSETFQVGSSHGILIANRQTGAVVSCSFNENTGFPLLAILSVDVEEWKRFHGKDEIDDQVDVLDLGIWIHEPNADEPTYEPADATHRSEVSKIHDLGFFFEVNALFS